MIERQTAIHAAMAHAGHPISEQTWQIDLLEGLGWHLRPEQSDELPLVVGPTGLVADYRPGVHDAAEVLRTLGLRELTST